MVITALCHHGSSPVWSGPCVCCVLKHLSLKYIACVLEWASVFALFILDGIFDDSQSSDWTERQIFDLSSVHQLFS